MPFGDPARLLRSEIVVGEVSTIGDEAILAFHPKKFEILFEVDNVLCGVRGPGLGMFEGGSICIDPGPPFLGGMVTDLCSW